MSTHFSSGVLVCLYFTAIAFTSILTVGAARFGAELPWASLPALALAMVASSLPLCALGLWLGSSFGSNSAPIVMVVVYLVLSSVSGIVVPMEMLEQSGPTLPRLAPLWPTYHAGALALAALRPAPAGSVLVHLAALAAFTVLFGTLFAFNARATRGAAAA